jgi:hypothetical protein
MIQNVFAVDVKSRRFGYLITDLLVVGFIYLLPTISHFTSIPFYIFDPMRIALVFCIIVTNQKNSLLIALTLPMFSLVVSSHPDFAKGILITAELALNVFAFYIFSESFKNKFIAMFISILIAKVFYYISKLLFINLGILQGDLFSTPIWLQYLVIVVLSIAAGITINRKKDPIPD